jgi:hypothetical protein
MSRARLADEQWTKVFDFPRQEAHCRRFVEDVL